MGIARKAGRSRGEAAETEKERKKKIKGSREKKEEEKKEEKCGTKTLRFGQHFFFEGIEKIVGRLNHPPCRMSTAISWSFKSNP